MKLPSVEDFQRMMSEQLNPPKNVNPEIFHKHLDECAQCREHPMALCLTGAALLKKAAGVRWRP